MKLRITALQMDLAWENPAANRDEIDRILNDEDQPTDLIVLPEMFTTGFSMNPAPIAERMQGETHRWMLQLAKKHDALVMGSLVIREGNEYFNRLLCCMPDGSTIKYDKKHPFSFAGEDEHYAAGEDFVTFVFRDWRICPMICYDLRFPVWARQRPGRNPYDLLVYVANWPAKRVSHWSALLTARAIENQACLVGVNRTGQDGNGIEYPGASIIRNGKGETMDEGNEQPKVLRATLNKDDLLDYREKFPAWQDADNFQFPAS